MATLRGFDANQGEPTSDFDPVPVGKYQAVITESEVKVNKAQNGSYLQLTFQIIEGEFKNRFLWAPTTRNCTPETCHCRSKDRCRLQECVW